MIKKREKAEFNKMNLNTLLQHAGNKENFANINDYLDFGMRYLEFIEKNLQADIVSKNEINYHFFQYNEEGTYNVTRPINTDLFMCLEEFDSARTIYMDILSHIRKGNRPQSEKNKIINRVVYTCQQSIGACLDALPANKSNTARKIMGDLFEKMILFILHEIGLHARCETIDIPFFDDHGSEYLMHYQHDIVVRQENNIRAIGSVKTSSKDRLDKVFLDKFMYNMLTRTTTPHFAVFLNDVQRKGKEPKYSVNSTFKQGHFKGYTIGLCPLDGVYYIDLRPNMNSDLFLHRHIRSFHELIVQDIWKFVD